MPYDNAHAITLDAATGADVRQRRFVLLGATGIAEATDGSDADGVSLELFDDSENTAGNASTAVPVVTNQGARVEVISGAAVAAGSNVASDSQGRCIVAATGDAILGKAITAASAAGQVMDIILSKAARVV